MYVRVENWRNNAQPNGRETRTEQDGAAGEPNGPAERSAGPEPDGTGEAGDASGDRGPVVWPEAGGRTAAWPAARPEGGPGAGLPGRPRPPGPSGEPAGAESTPVAGSWFDKGTGARVGAGAARGRAGRDGVLGRPRFDRGAGAASDTTPGSPQGTASAGADLLAPFDTARPSVRSGSVGVGASSASPEAGTLPENAEFFASAPVARVTSDMDTFGAAEPGTAVLPGPVAGTGAPGTPSAPAGPGPRPTWERTGEPGRNHDPHEVTVQLDGIGRRLDGSRTTPPGAAAGPLGASDSRDSDGPVFVDESGRRSRRFRRVGIAVGIACGLYALVIVATLLSGNSAAPWVPVPIPGAGDGAPASKVEDSTGPTDSADPSAATGGVLPGVSADPGAPSAGATPSAGGSAAPAASAGSSKKPGASTSKKPKPSASTTKKSSGGTKTDPGTGGDSGTVVDPPASSSPDASPDTSPAPSPSGGTGDAGGSGTTTNNAADGPAAQTPVAAGGPSAAAPAKSPENTL